MVRPSINTAVCCTFITGTQAVHYCTPWGEQLLMTAEEGVISVAFVPLRVDGVGGDSSSQAVHFGEPYISPSFVAWFHM